MEQGLLKVNALTIAVSGLLMLLTGLFLYLFRDSVGANIRFFLPIPPIGVAAYIFVFNMFAHYQGELPGNTWDTIRELAFSTAVLAIVFGAFATTNVIITYYLKGLR